MLRGFVSIGLVCALAGPALAQDANDIHLGEPAYGGSGCPDGTVSAVLSHDAKSLSLLFDSYIAETNGSRTTARSSCNVAVPVHVPQGFSVSLIAVDYRGFADIPRGGSGQFRVEYFFAGQRGPRSTETFRGGYSDDFLVEDDLLVGALVWSRCGADVILRSNSSLLARKRRANDPEAFLAVDSADFEAGMLYHLQWRRCH